MKLDSKVTKIVTGKVTETSVSGSNSFAKPAKSLPLNASVWGKLASDFRKLGYKATLRKRYDYQAGAQVLDSLTVTDTGTNFKYKYQPNIETFKVSYGNELEAYEDLKRKVLQEYLKEKSEKRLKAIIVEKEEIKNG